MSNENLPNILVQSLKLEYETTPISIDELCTKHKLQKESLPYTSWNKLENTNTCNNGEILIVPSSISLPDSYDDEDLDNLDDSEDHLSATTIQNSINKTAKSIIRQVNTYMIEAEDISAKDIKDLSSALISLKESVLGKDPTVKVEVTNNTQINVLSELLSTIKGAPRDC